MRYLAARSILKEHLIKNYISFKMKISNKIAVAALSLVCIGSAVSAQSLDDAKKAIDAEQYQKAKNMLKNLTVTQPTKDENYFYLGWTYLKEDEPDSAKIWFNKGIAVNAQSSLNYAGLGAVARLSKDNAGATSNFNQALSYAPKKDAEPYIYIGKSYLLPVAGVAPTMADAQAAAAVLNKAVVINKNSAEAYLTLGDADRIMLNGGDEYTNNGQAATLDPKNPAIDVAVGVSLMYANNFEDAIADFQKAIAKDPNYGPAYREWAETDVRWAKNDPKVAVDKANDAVVQYKKYLSLTDMSLQSQLHYADFLTYAGKYDELETVAKQLSQYANTNLRVYRYLGYAAYQNKDYPAGLSAMNTWMTKAAPSRIIPQDYLYLGRLQIATGSDSLGVQSLKKAYGLDSTQADVFLEIAKSNYKQGKYQAAAEAYAMYIKKSRNVTLSDYYLEGLSYYKAFTEQYSSTVTPKPTPDTTFITKADSAFAYVNKNASKPYAPTYLYLARLYDFKETDRNNIKGLAKPYYEKYIAVETANLPVKDADKPFLAEAYDYLGRYYELIAKDDVKANDNYTQALVYDPTDAGALDYMKRKGKK
jgi:tetratricopeptide (TPR) repeat protein